MRKVFAFTTAILCMASTVHALVQNSTVVAPNTVVSKGIQITLTINRERYEPGEPMDLKVSLTNISGKPMNFEFSGTPVYEIWVSSAAGGEVWRYKGELYSGRVHFRLQPGESKVYYASWNQMTKQKKPVSPGWYEVSCKFSAAEAHLPPARVRFKIDERLANGPLVILVPITLDKVNPSTDLGKPISIEGILRQGPQGVYVDVSNVNVKK